MTGQVISVPPRDKLTLAALVETYVSDRLARGEIGASTAKQFRIRLGSLSSAGPTDQSAADVDRETILAWQATIGHLAPASRKAYLSTVRSFCRWCVTSGFMDADPTVTVGRVRLSRRVPRALSHDQVAQVFAAAGMDVRMRTILWLMVGCGLRCVEVANLTVADYDRNAGTLFVKGKFDNERVLPVPDEVAAALDFYLQVGGWQVGPLIRTVRSGLQTSGARQRGEARPGGASGLGALAISQQVSALMTKAGIKSHAYDGTSAHALRHTCASDVLDRCHDLRLVKELLGHLHLSSTEIYLRNADLDQLRDAMEGRSYRAGGMTGPADLVRPA
ncbi:MAG TPA: tyrosine-type recombinase/integrase [Acidimicrobiales bacterium]|nr:tyrosine-type recombinase/integrase [Acidimicrobiales bacterium]